MRNLQELPKLRDSLSYLYLEHGRLEQDAKSVAFIDKNGGFTPIPAANLSVLMMGPGTTVTHAAIKALADNGCIVIWSGQDGTRMYATGIGETRKAYRLLKQAELATDPDKRMVVVRQMYQFRFQEQFSSTLTLEQVRGKEGARVREAYATASRETGILWHGRRYDRGNWGNADPINRAISAANAMLNGLCHTAIVSGGYAPALGFIHTGKQLSFVYDIADLYKADITIPLAFRVTAKGTEKLEQRIREACRETFKKEKLLQRILPDIDHILQTENIIPDDAPNPDTDPGVPTPWWGEADTNLFGAQKEV